MVETRIVDRPNDFVIDALNVCCWQRMRVSLSVLLTLIRELTHRGATYVCVFDAVTPYRLTEEDIDTYNELLTQFPDRFTEVTGGIQADDIILSIAQQSNSSVISNDQFRNKKYLERHPWLQTHQHRLIKGCVAKQSLIITELSIHTEILADSAFLLQEIRQELRKAANTQQGSAVSDAHVFLHATEKPQRAKSVVDNENHGDVMRAQPSTIKQPIAKEAPRCGKRDLEKRKRILQEIENFRAEDARRRRAEKRLTK